MPWPRKKGWMDDQPHPESWTQLALSPECSKNTRPAQPRHSSILGTPTQTSPLSGEMDRITPKQRLTTPRGRTQQVCDVPSTAFLWEGRQGAGARRFRAIPASPMDSFKELVPELAYSISGSATMTAKIILQKAWSPYQLWYWPKLRQLLGLQRGSP